MTAVLIADNDSTRRELLSSVLTRRGFVADATGSGDLALERLQRSSPSLIVCSADLPGVSGEELASRAKAQNSQVRVVLLASPRALSTSLPAEQACDAVLDHPFQVADLNALLEEWHLVSNVGLPTLGAGGPAIPAPKVPAQLRLMTMRMPSVRLKKPTDDLGLPAMPIPVPLAVPGAGPMAVSDGGGPSLPAVQLREPPPASPSPSVPAPAPVPAPRPAAPAQPAENTPATPAPEIPLTEPAEPEAALPEIALVEPVPEETETALPEIALEEPAPEANEEALSEIPLEESAPSEEVLPEIDIEESAPSEEALPEIDLEESAPSKEALPEIDLEEPAPDEALPEIDLEEPAPEEREQALVEIDLEEPVAREPTPEESLPEIAVEEGPAAEDAPPAAAFALNRSVEADVGLPDVPAESPVVPEEMVGFPPPHGTLEQIGLPRIIFEIYTHTFSGILHLSRQGLTRDIYFLGGIPMRVDSVQLSENLGRMLVDHGRISTEQYSSAQQVVQERKVRQGEALIAIGALTESDLLDALQMQAELKLTNSFAWHDGQYLLDAHEGLQLLRCARRRSPRNHRRHRRRLHQSHGAAAAERAARDPVRLGGQTRPGAGQYVDHRAHRAARSTRPRALLG